MNVRWQLAEAAKTTHGQLTREYQIRLDMIPMEEIRVVARKCQLPQWLAKTSTRESDPRERVTQVGENVFLDFRGDFWQVHNLTLPLDLTNAQMICRFTYEQIQAIADFIQSHEGDKTLHAP